jgi:hypothetical protein
MNPTTPLRRLHLKSLMAIGISCVGLAAFAARAEEPHFSISLGADHQGAHYAAEMREKLAHIDRRRDHQLRRIVEGMEQRQLSMHEAIDLLRERMDIDEAEHSYLADGRLSPQEVDSLNDRLSRASRHIAQEKHDRDGTRDWRHHGHEHWEGEER